VARLIAVTPTQGLGLPIAHGTVRLHEVEPGPVTSIAPFRGADLSGVLGALPEPGRVVPWGEGRLLWSGHGRWTLLGVPAPEGLSGLAAVVDQSDAATRLHLSGAAVLDVLARLVPVDLREVPEGRALRTFLNHMTVTLIRDAEGWEIHGFRSMAGTLVHEIAEAMRRVAARAAV
jgi:heterotetrameric sarcosine oxidase gamma subunit